MRNEVANTAEAIKLRTDVVLNRYRGKRLNPLFVAHEVVRLSVGPSHRLAYLKKLVAEYLASEIIAGRLLRFEGDAAGIELPIG